ncbi:MAG: SDR family oxidoreductase [Steroidobacteraceae bacterium]
MTNLDTSPVPDYLRMLRLDGKGYVIIGGGQGIGRQAAHALRQAGAKVAIVGRSKEMTEATAAEVKGFAILGDATKRVDMQRIFAEASDKLGGVHGIVDTLGQVCRKPIVAATDEDIAWQYDIVLRHALLATQIGGPMIAANGGGTITFVGSVSGITWLSNHGLYGTSKAALHQLVRAAAMELAEQKVRVNIVTPNVVQTPRVKGYMDSGRGARAIDYYPLGRLATPADVASAILYLSTDLSSYVTGQMLLVDSGMTIQNPMPESVWFEEGE